jgi:hypothetical protein
MELCKTGVMSDMMSGSESVAMSLADHSRRFDRLSFTSGLPRSTDIAGPFPLVRLAPTCDIEMPVVPVLTIEKGGGFLFSALLRMGRLMICPTGKSVACVSSPRLKNISLNPSGKSLLQLRPSRPKEGRWPSSRTLGGMRWTRRRRKTNGAFARRSLLGEDG